MSMTRSELIPLLHEELTVAKFDCWLCSGKEVVETERGDVEFRERPYLFTDSAFTFFALDYMESKGYIPVLEPVICSVTPSGHMLTGEYRLTLKCVRRFFEAPDRTLAVALALLEVLREENKKEVENV